MNDGTLWSFEYFYHVDKANACMHRAPVKFSPITFMLVDELFADLPLDQDCTSEMTEVKSHKNQYELDKGR